MDSENLPVWAWTNHSTQQNATSDWLGLIAGFIAKRK